MTSSSTTVSGANSSFTNEAGGTITYNPGSGDSVTYGIPLVNSGTFTIESGTMAAGVAITNDGQWMLTGSKRREAILWRTWDDKPHGVLAGLHQDVAAVAIAHRFLTEKRLSRRLS